MIINAGEKCPHCDRPGGGDAPADGRIDGESYWRIGERYFNVRYYSQAEAIRLASLRR